ncbi:hypothetical protein J4Q44_G00109000 [Coregonus suidteri]|uniref:Uncharacterized protein n=1 Tax=Coregonus suidteri TaxID=861788 RepID=A0AAN8M174_9TELE
MVPFWIVPLCVLDSRAGQSQEYLRVKRELVVRADSHAVAHPPATAANLEPPPRRCPLQLIPVTPLIPSYLSCPCVTSPHSARASASAASPAMAPQSQAYSSTMGIQSTGLPMSSDSPVPKMAPSPSQAPNIMGAPQRPLWLWVAHRPHGCPSRGGGGDPLSTTW